MGFEPSTPSFAGGNKTNYANGAENVEFTHTCFSLLIYFQFLEGRGCLSTNYSPLIITIWAGRCNPTRGKGKL